MCSDVFFVKLKKSSRIGFANSMAITIARVWNFHFLIYSELCLNFLIISENYLFERNKRTDVLLIKFIRLMRYYYFYYYYYFNWNTFKTYDFKKRRKSKSRLDQKLCQFLFFQCEIIFGKLSELGQISCAIPYCTEIKDFYIWEGLLSIFLKIGTKWEKL